jgi:hypothetical protein
LKRSRIILVLSLSWAGTAAPLVPNLPSGTLTPNFEIVSRLGTFPNGVVSSPRPSLPPSLPRRWQSAGVIVLDLSPRSGYVDNARVLQTTGIREVDDLLISAMMQWRIRPHTVYKLYVPVRITAGKIYFGGSNPL